MEPDEIRAALESSDAEIKSSWPVKDCSLRAEDGECASKILKIILDDLNGVPSQPSVTLQAIRDSLDDPGMGEAIAYEVSYRVAQQTAELEKLQRELTELKIQCLQCICPPEGTDECCPVCIPGDPRGDIFAQHAALLTLAKKTVSARIGPCVELSLSRFGDDLWIRDEVLEAERQLGFKL